jgi:hypothetical protein
MLTVVQSFVCARDDRNPWPLGMTVTLAVALPVALRELVASAATAAPVRPAAASALNPTIPHLVTPYLRIVGYNVMHQVIIVLPFRTREWDLCKVREATIALTAPNTTASVPQLTLTTTKLSDREAQMRYR